MNYTFRPLLAWTEGSTRDRRSRWTFKAPWADTLRLLADELEKLNARNVVIQVDIREGDVRRDGMLRADAKVNHPGVRVAFDSRYGPLTYATDTHEFWQHNVRAIALALQALRAVDRYGVTRRGEQYTGWKALLAGTGAIATGMTYSDAVMVISQHVHLEDNEQITPSVIRRAKAAAHPDRHDGDQTAWNQLEQAIAVFDRHTASGR